MSLINTSNIGILSNTFVLDSNAVHAQINLTSNVAYITSNYSYNIVSASPSGFTVSNATTVTSCNIVVNTSNYATNTPLVILDPYLGNISSNGVGNCNSIVIGQSLTPFKAGRFGFYYYYNNGTGGTVSQALSTTNGLTMGLIGGCNFNIFGQGTETQGAALYHGQSVYKHINTAVNGYYFLYTGNSNFYITNYSGAVGVTILNYGNAWSSTSDLSLKKNIVKINQLDAHANVLKLNPIRYHFKTDEEARALRQGLIAQEVQKVFPEVVGEMKDGLLAITFTDFIPYLIASIKELQKQHEALKAIVNTLI